MTVVDVKRRYFVLRGRTLNYFVGPTERDVKGSIAVPNLAQPPLLLLFLWAAVGEA